MSGGRVSLDATGVGDTAPAKTSTGVSRRNRKGAGEINLDSASREGVILLQGRRIRGDLYQFMSRRNGSHDGGPRGLIREDYSRAFQKKKGEVCTRRTRTPETKPGPLKKLARLAAKGEKTGGEPVDNDGWRSAYSKIGHRKGGGGWGVDNREKPGGGTCWWMGPPSIKSQFISGKRKGALKPLIWGRRLSLRQKGRTNTSRGIDSKKQFYLKEICMQRPACSK